MKKRIFCTALAFCLVLSMAGCDLFEGEPRPDFPYQYLTFGSAAESPVTSDGQRDYVIAGRFICSVDKETGEVRPVCGKSGCPHEMSPDDRLSECNAYVKSGINFPFIQWYEGNLYFIDGGKGELTGKEVLMRLSEDGASREELCALKLVPEEEPVGILEFAGIHRGWFYTVVWQASPSVLYAAPRPHRMQRVSVDNPGAGPETVFAIESSDSMEVVPLGSHFYLSTVRKKGKNPVVLDYDLQKQRIKALSADKGIFGVRQGKLVLKEELPRKNDSWSGELRLFLYDPESGDETQIITFPEFEGNHYVYVGDRYIYEERLDNLGRQRMIIHDAEENVVYNELLPGDFNGEYFVPGEECAFFCGNTFVWTGTEMEQLFALLKLDKENGFKNELIVTLCSMRDGREIHTIEK